MSRILLLAREPSTAQQWRGELVAVGGHEVVAVADSSLAARTLLDLHTPDLVVCELRLADGTALAMIQWLALQPRCPLIVGVAHDEAEPLLYQALRSGADNICGAGGTRGALAVCVNQTLRGETGFTQPIAHALLDHFEHLHAQLAHTVGDEQSPLQLEPPQRELLMKLAVGYRIDQLAQAQQASSRRLGQQLRAIVRKLQWDLRAGALGLSLI